MTGPRYLARWVFAAILLLAFAAFGLLCLSAGMALGVVFVEAGSSVADGLLAWERITKFVPEAFRRNPRDVVSVMPLVVAVLAAAHGGWSKRLVELAKSVVQFLVECLKFPAGQHSWSGKSGKSGKPGESGKSGESDKPGLVQSFLAPCPHLTVAAFLLGSFGATPAEPSRPPVVYVLSSDSMLSVLPIHPLVHFENADVGPDGELTERGVTLSDARKAALEEVVEALRPCAAADRPVTIRPYGFASDDPFRFFDGLRDDSDELKEYLATILGQATPEDAPELLDEWLEWAARSRLKPFVKLGRTIRKHAEGILAYLDTRMTNGPVEGINNKLRMIARRAYGFHSAGALISMLFLCSGGIELHPPLPTRV